MYCFATDKTEIYLGAEPEIKRLFKSFPTASEIEGMLRLVGLELSDFYEKYGAEKINEAISYAKDLKDRYSVLWLYYELFAVLAEGKCTSRNSVTAAASLRKKDIP